MMRPRHLPLKQGKRMYRRVSSKEWADTGQMTSPLDFPSHIDGWILRQAYAVTNHSSEGLSYSAVSPIAAPFGVQALAKTSSGGSCVSAPRRPPSIG